MVAAVFWPAGFDQRRTGHEIYSFSGNPYALDFGTNAFIRRTRERYERQGLRVFRSYVQGHQLAELRKVDVHVAHAGLPPKKRRLAAVPSFAYKLYENRRFYRFAREDD